MTTTLQSTERQQLATFYLGDLRFGVDILEIQEINRERDMTEVPHTPRHVRGVINLRGEVVSILDLKCILALGEAACEKSSRNIILHGEGEPVGLMVDRLSDVVDIDLAEVEPPPANIAGVDARFMRGVFQLEDELLVLLKIGELTAAPEAHQRS